MVKKPVHSSKDNESGLRKGAKIAKDKGDEKAAKRVERIMKHRRDRGEDRAKEYKQEQSRPQYNPRGPN